MLNANTLYMYYTISNNLNPDLTNHQRLAK